MARDWIIVLDIGKTLSKATLWDEGGRCVAERSRPNQRLTSGVAFTLDASRIEHWLQQVLQEYARMGPVSAIIPVAHGAAACLIRDDRLQGAPIDYEWPGLEAHRAAYNLQRDAFAATGSPSLPAGLNLGMQLHWLESLRTANFRSGTILPWAQYWAWVLSGILACEVTSLGCHTDLWRPFERAPSELAVRRGWAERLGPLTHAGAILGRISKDWVGRTGLSSGVEIYCGLHDSNAALLAARQHPALKGHDATVLSTGTWFVAMRSPLGKDIKTRELSENRDCLVNVDVLGAPVPSSRFMGGREIEILMGGASAATLSADEDAAARQESAIRAIDRGKMILPGQVPGVGPFPYVQRPVKPLAGGDDNTVLAHLYAALIADVSLDLIGSRDALFIDGRFSRAPVFVQALARLRPETAVFISQDERGVAHGALHLVNKDFLPTSALERVAPLPVDMLHYRARWREATQRLK